MRKFLFVIGVSLLTILPPQAGAFFARAGRDGIPADIVYTQPGELISVNGFRLNLYCMGTGSPTVVFDSGWEDWAPAWSKVQPEIAKRTRACSYDRAGTGFSEPGPMPRTSMRIAHELHTALQHVGIRGPYILVGHAFGGDNVRLFADMYLREVAGLVLVDADPADLEPQTMREEAHRGQVRIISQLRNCRDAIAEHQPLPMLQSRSGQGPRTCVQQFFRGLPEPEWSPGLNAKLLEIAQTKVAMYDAYISEMEQMPADEAYLQQHRRSLGSIPIRVLTSGNHGVGHLGHKPPDTAEHLDYEQETTRAQARWLELSSNAKQIFARYSSEYIQFDEPETVINAIREVYEQARRHYGRRRLHAGIAGERGANGILSGGQVTSLAQGVMNSQLGASSFFLAVGSFISRKHSCRFVERCSSSCKTVSSQGRAAAEFEPELHVRTK